MRKLQADFEIIPQPEATDRMGVLMHLEKIGRICYKSEDKITTDSCLKYIQNLRDRKHWAMLEHFTFVFSIPKRLWKDITSRRWYLGDPDVQWGMKFINITRDRTATKESGMRYLVSGSATAFNNLWKATVYEKEFYSTVPQLALFLSRHIPELMVNPWEEWNNDVEIDSRIRLLSRAEIEALPNLVRIMHDTMSVIYSVDRGVTHELVRHRPAAWAQESTRYCDYSKGETGGGINVIEPLFFEPGTDEYQIWEDVCQYINDAYIKLTKKKKDGGLYERLPQEARAILPQSTKADIVMTAPLYEMLHFFKMRLPKTAHPQMREVSVPVFHETYEKEPEIFEGLKEWAEKGVS